MKILDRAIVALLPAVPKSVVRRIANRYIAGESLDDAVRVVRSLNGAGCEATIDVLGEFITDFREAEATAAAYRDTLDRIGAESLRSNVSIKLTAFGLSLDGERCYALVRELVARARDLGNFVRIDMEDSSVTTKTLDVYRRLRAEGFENTGVVLQAYMRRSADDVRELLPLRPSIRLCKGIYVEPPTVAFKDREEVRRSYRDLLRLMLAGGASRVGIATHDPPLVDDAQLALQELAVPKERYEFQMLLGVAESLRRRLVTAGHTMRVYVPYGGAWYGYSVRRIKENPSIAGYVAKGMLGF